MSKVSKITLTIGLCAAAFVVSAAEPQKTNTSKVRFGDLNLETEQGAGRLYSRLRVAADGVCEVHTAWPGLELRAIEQRCVRAAIADAVAKINRPQLTAYYRNKSGVKSEQVLSKL